MKYSIVLTDNDFKNQVLESDIPVLVDFWASWCPPCKMVEPVIQESARDLKGITKIAKINVDQNPVSAFTYEVVGVPTFVLFREGNEISRCVGAQSKQQLLDMLENAGILETQLETQGLK